ncbi:MAG: hypothetical protein HYS04_12270 [Acidobacteria bacterium]|nr:hypothetical protein [Acidobacteriota bacterium]
MRPDPYVASGGAADPGSWNRYGYLGGDPVNFSDPWGLQQCPAPCFSITVFGRDASVAAFLGGSAREGQNVALPEERVTGEELNPQGFAEFRISRISNFSTTSTHAVGAQNSLRWLRQALELDEDCNEWLTDNAEVINTLLGEGPDSSTVYAGVGNFSDPNVNAVAGVGGTNLLPGSALLTVNVQGAFFSSGASTDNGRLRGGTDEAKAFILLHELGHLTVAAGFQSGDRAPNIQRARNDLVHEHCQNTLDRAAGRRR